MIRLYIIVSVPLSVIKCHNFYPCPRDRLQAVLCKDLATKKSRSGNCRIKCMISLQNFKKVKLKLSWSIVHLLFQPQRTVLIESLCDSSHKLQATL